MRMDCPRPGRSRWMRQRPLPAQKTRWGGVSVPWPSGSARAAAGNIPQASAAARPRLRSETARFSLMSDLLLSQAGARPSGAQNRCRPVSIPWPNIPLRSAFRNPKRRGRTCSVCRRGGGRQAAEGPLATFARAAPGGCRLSLSYAAGGSSCGKNTSRRALGLCLPIREPTTMSAPATAMPMTIWCRSATLKPRAMVAQ